MKKILLSLFFFASIFCFSMSVQAADNQQVITLKSGWNIVSTPKILSSHQFSVAEDSTNLDIYVMDPSSPSSWQTMPGISQTEFQPLYAYFINNKTGIDQTLTFTYNLNLNPSERLFSRLLKHGWNVVGISSPSYALSQYQTSVDINNPSSILNSIIGSVDSVIDFTFGNSQYYSPKVSATWVLKNPAEVNSLNDFRELKGYGVYVSGQTATYIGYQNIDPTEEAIGTLSVTTDNSTLPTTVISNSSHVLIGRYIFTATGEPIKVDNLYVGMTLGTDIVGATLRNGQVRINGSQAGTTQNIARAALTDAGLTPFVVNYTFQPGVATTVEIYADIFNNGTAPALATGNTIRTDLLVPGAARLNGTRQISLGLIAVPNVAQNSATISIVGANGTLSATSSYANQTTVLPQTTFKIGSWTMAADTAEDINVNNLSFAIAPVTGTTFNVGQIGNMYVVYRVGSSNAVTSSVTPAPGTPQAFSVNFTLPRTQIVTIELYADLLGGNVVAGHSARATLTVASTGVVSGATVAIPATLGQIITAQVSSMVVTRDASTPNAGLVAQNNTISSVAYKFAAQNDNFDVIQLTFSINDPSAVSQVNLMDGTTVIQSQPAYSTVVFNDFATPITINANQSKILTLQLILGAVGVGAGNTGANITSDLVGGPGSSASLVRPASTGMATGLTYTDTPGNAIFVYHAIPTITSVTLPSGTLTPGSNTIAKFQVGTTGGQISWKEIQFSVSKTGGAGKASIASNTDVSLWDNDSNVQISATVNIPGGGIADVETTDTITIVLTNEQQVSGNKNYELRANLTVAGSIATGDYFQTRILNPSTIFSSSTTYVNAVALNPSFVWSDNSGALHSEITADWTTDYLVKNLPTNNQNLVR